MAAREDRRHGLSGNELLKLLIGGCERTNTAVLGKPESPGPLLT